MKRLLCLLALLILTAGLPAYASEELTPEKKADIANLLSMTGVLDIANVLANLISQQMISAIQSVRPDIPSNTFEIIREETRKAADECLSEEGGLIDLVVPIYNRNFTHDEIKHLISFYSTPLGKKLIKTMPGMMQECMVVGQQWGNQIGPILQERIRARLRKKGIDV